MTLRSGLIVLLLLSVPFLAGFDNEIIAQFSGEMTVGGNFGATVASVGDVDGDGIGDFVIGDQGFDGTGSQNQGRAYLFLTRREPLRFERIVLAGLGQAGLYGKEISGLGDLDGDRRAEFSVTSENQRQVDVFFGRPTWPWVEKRTLVAPSGVRTSDAFGLGDVNGDGRPDVLIEAILARRAYVVSWPGAWEIGQATMLDREVPGLGTVDFLRGHAAGDVDADGFPDFVLTASRVIDGVYHEYALLYRGWPGPIALFQPSEILQLYPGGSMDFFDLEIGPDLDGDGRPELLVTHNSSRENGGTTRLSALGYHGPGRWEVVRTFGAGEPAYPSYSSVVANIDIDGDGADDVVVEDRFQAPNLRVYPGPFREERVEESSFLPTSRGLLPWFIASDVANVGDLDGDGMADLLVGAESHPRGVGSAYLLRGGASRALDVDVVRTENEGRGQNVLTVTARIAGAPSPEPAVVTSIQLRFRSAAWPYTDVTGARILKSGSWATSSSVEGGLLTINLTSQAGVTIDGSPTDLVQIVSRPIGGLQRSIDLYAASVTTLDGPSLWVNVTESSMHDVPRDSDPGPDLVARGQISASPSPANPRTSFRIDAPDPGTVVLQVFDVRGRQVWEHRVEVAVAGRFDVVWGGIDAHGQQVASGVYTARVAGRGWQATTRVVIVR